jgi:polyadenylate-binding protein
MMNYYQGQKPSKQSKMVNTGVVLYLGELPPELDQYELHQFIMSHGKFNVESLIVKPTKENKSYAYVKFKTKSEVEKARKALHMKSFRDYVVKAEPFKQKEETGGSDKPEENTNLFVKNLSATTTPKDLYDLFIKYGNIISIKLKQNINGECLGYGYVNYEDNKNAENALESLNDSEYMGKRLQVTHFHPRKERNAEETEKFPLVLIKLMPDRIDSEAKLEEIFVKFGQIAFCGLISGNESIDSLHNLSIPKSITGNESNSLSDEQNLITSYSISENKRMGVVLFAKKEDASSAVKSLDQAILDESGVPLSLSLAPINQETLDKLWKAKQESYKKKYEGCNLVIKNIPKEISEKNLFEIFKQFGDIAGARIATEGRMKEIKNENGEVLDKVFQYESKGYGFVLFRNIEDARAAKEALNNQQISFKNSTLKLIVEYYDYSKVNNRDIANLGQIMNKPNEKKGYANKKKFNNNNTRKNRDDNMAMNAHMMVNNDKNQPMVVNNRTIYNPRQIPEKKVNYN